MVLSQLGRAESTQWCLVNLIGFDFLDSGNKDTIIQTINSRKVVRVPLVFEIETWEKLRKVVDRVVPFGVQEVLYNYFSSLPKIGSQFYRPYDYGLVFLYWLIVGDSLNCIAEKCMIYNYFFIFIIFIAYLFLFICFFLWYTSGPDQRRNTQN